MNDRKRTPPMPPIRKSLTVPVSPEQAFHRFTREMSSWWPLRSHSVGQQDAESVTMEERSGGRIVERIRGGRECVWGKITACEPPRRVSFTWHPGQDPTTAQDIDVRFTPAGSATKVELEHRGFERLGRLARRARRGYPIGWAYVLGRFGGRKGPFMALVSAIGAVMMAVGRIRVRRMRRRGSATATSAGSSGS